MRFFSTSCENTGLEDERKSRVKSRAVRYLIFDLLTCVLYFRFLLKPRPSAKPNSFPREDWTSVSDFLYDERAVLGAEPDAVAEGNAHALLARLIGHVIE